MVDKITEAYKNFEEAQIMMAGGEWIYAFLWADTFLAGVLVAWLVISDIRRRANG